jgi:hypothetical protein
MTDGGRRIDANSPAAIQEVARRYAEALDGGVNADPARAAAVVERILDGAPISFDAFYVKQDGAAHLPAKDLLRAQLVKLLADIGMGDTARFIDHPEHGAKHVGELVEGALKEAKKRIEDAFRYGKEPDEEAVRSLAKRYSPTLVFEVLAGRALDSRSWGSKNEIDPERRQVLDQFAKHFGLEASVALWEDRIRALDLESALRSLEHRPTAESVAKARALGATPAKLRQVARQAYLTSLEYTFITSEEVEKAFASVGFKASSIGKAARQQALDRKEARGKESLAADVGRLAKSGVRSEEDVDAAVATLRGAYLSKAMPEEDLTRAAIDIWLKAEAKTWAGSFPWVQSLRGMALFIAGQERLAAAARDIEALKEKDFTEARERAIAQPRNAIFQTDFGQGWLNAFANRVDTRTGEPLPAELIARMDRAVLRFWNTMAHDPGVKPEIRESWIRFLPDRFPHLRNRMSETPMHFSGETDLSELLLTSPFATSKDWKPFVDGVLAGLSGESSPSDVYRAFERVTEREPPAWMPEEVRRLPPDRIRQFAAEGVRLASTLHER